MTKARERTQLEYAIIGLVHDSPLSGYAIRQVFETTALGNYSGGQGSIYPALTRLVKAGLLGKKSVGSKEKYFVSRQGKAAFKRWLMLPVDKKDIEKRNDLLVMRFSFMSNILTGKEIRAFMKRYEELTRAYVAELKEFRDEHLELFKVSGLLSLDVGIETLITRAAWARRVLRTI